MDYWGIVRESWRVSWRERALWPLGLIRGVSNGLGVVVALLALVPLTFLLVMVGLAPSTPEISNLMNDIDFQRLTGFFSTYMVVVVMLLLIWVAIAVFDVAATGGLITQVDSAEEGRGVRAGSGVAEGFGLWGRTAALLAVAAMPTLLAMLVRSSVLFFQFGLPALSGATPDPGASLGGYYLTAPLSAIAAVISVPLAVLVQLAMRFGLLDGQDWKTAMRSAWDVSRARLEPVALMWLTALLAGIVVSTVFSLAFSVAFGAGLLAAIPSFTALDFDGAAIRGISVSGVLSVLLVTAVYAVAAPFLSALWTIFFRALTGRDARFERIKPSAGQTPANVTTDGGV